MTIDNVPVTKDVEQTLKTLQPGLAGVNFDQVGFDTTMANEPILSNVKDFLGIVPMVLTIWPALFTGFHLLATKNKNHTNHEDGHSEQEDHKP